MAMLAERPFTASDFTSDDLRVAWINFSNAVTRVTEFIDKPGISEASRQGMLKLRDKHLLRLKTLEEAQRIINTDRLIQGLDR